MQNYLVVERKGKYPDDWRGMGFVTHYSRQAAEREAWRRWPGRDVVARPVDAGDPAVYSRWMQEALKAQGA